jgi:hypothetical protein
MVIPPWGSLEDTHPDTWHPGLIVIEYQSNKHDAYRLRTLVVYLPDYTRLAQIENRIKAKKPEIIPHNETMDIDPTARRLLSYNLPTSNIFPPKQLTLCQFPKKMKRFNTEPRAQQFTVYRVDIRKIGLVYMLPVPYIRYIYNIINIYIYIMYMYPMYVYIYM